VSENAALVGRITGYSSDLDRVVDRIHMLSQKAIESGDDGYWDGVALNLHGYYSGVERIFEEIARTVDGTIPSGPDWHQSLLFQMSAGISDLRPPVISVQLRNFLDDYRGFRHVVRNVYAFNFRPARLKELVDNIAECHTLLKNDLNEFAQFLTRIN
jgi:hypothetical protein